MEFIDCKHIYRTTHLLKNRLMRVGREQTLKEFNIKSPYIFDGDWQLFKFSKCTSFLVLHFFGKLCQWPLLNLLHEFCLLKLDWFIHQVCTLSLIFDAYASRWRAQICNFFYEEKASARADFLYKRIRSGRYSVANISKHLRHVLFWDTFSPYWLSLKQ